ncbi:SLC13 family permease [Posidoniimonas polymericola]|uniref:SLC13 family permease n=1 Tax=Posidoniimonas polymericola TaxID=2528002 RepID=UPI0018D4811D|nr:SLC13 family permease [Posidoniimonas polymericola]
MTTLCAVWWVAEPIPIPVTSLLPLAIFPLVGVLSAKDVGEAYGSPLVLLMLGGFMLSAAMEKSGAHRRIAIGMVNLFGGGGRQLVFGFMAAAAFLSMWISNTATALMMLPIAMAVLQQSKDRNLARALLLGITYAASIGGIGTPIGTPPNLLFMEVYAQTTGVEPTFLQWMGWALPIMAVMLPLAAFWLTRSVARDDQIALPQAGRWRAEEVRTLVIFSVAALLWVTRKEPFGGWSSLAGLPSANDASIALLAVIALFIAPNGKGARLLDWPTAAKIPWGILILYGGGIAIAKSFSESGVSDALGGVVSGLAELPTILLIGAVCFTVTFLTEVTSNTATTALLMPILAAAATAAGIEPRLLMAPAAISASFAFMMPVATPPNAIVFGAGKLSMREMAREGFVLNLAGVVVVTLLATWLLGN